MAQVVEISRRLAVPGHAAVVTIFETAAFRAMSARDVVRDADVLVVEAVSRSVRSDAALDRLFRAHAAPVHPVIAVARERVQTAERSYVVFDAPVVTDLEGLVRYGTAARVKATHAEADGLIIALRDALLASARDPSRLPADRHLGTIATSNVLFAMDGRFFVVGLGHNVAVHDADGEIVTRSRFFHAPEIAMGMPPTEQSDFVGLLILVRGMLAFIDVNVTVARAIMGNSLAEDIELVKHILYIESQVIHASPGSRISIEKTIEVSNRIRELAGIRPDTSAFVRRVAQLLGTVFEARAPYGDRPPLRVCAHATFLERPPRERIDLSRRAVLGRTLLALARARVGTPGQVLDVAALAAACWPGERILPDAAANRVYVSVSSLRRLGLGPDLEHVDGGYRIAPGVPCELVDT